jgi:small ligand-binding sensory domain FIST
MKFTSAATTDSDAGRAVQALAEQIDQAEPDLLVVFISAEFTHDVRAIVDGLCAALNPRLVIGCTAEGVISQDCEIENEPAIALIAGWMLGVELTHFVLQAAASDWPTLLLSEEEFCRMVGAPPDAQLVMLFGDPFSTPMDDLLEAFNTHCSGIPLAGGIASGGLRPHGNALFINDQIVQEGVVGVVFSGQVDINIVVSQGCRPIWRPFKIVTARQNVIFNLEGRPPLAWLQDLVPELPEEDRALLQNGLFVGRAIKTGQEALGRGDFVIRGVISIDEESGAIAIGDSVMDGQIIQFHLRDAVTAQEDLEMMLIPQMFRDGPSGALLFTCNGRGTRLYDRPNGDVSVIQKNIQDTPLAGFFCAGEIGPIGDVNFIHGETATLVLFRQAESAL